MGKIKEWLLGTYGDGFADMQRVSIVPPFYRSAEDLAAYWHLIDDHRRDDAVTLCELESVSTSEAFEEFISRLDDEDYDWSNIDWCDDQEVLDLLSRSRNERVRCAVAYNESTRPQTLMRLVEDPCSLMPFYLVGNESLPPAGRSGIMVRLQHISETDEDADLRQAASLQLKAMELVSSLLN